MVPKYCFLVEIDRRQGGDLHRESHNFESLQAASAYASIAIKKPMVRTVRVMVVLEQLSKNGADGLVGYVEERRSVQ